MGAGPPGTCPRSAPSQGPPSSRGLASSPRCWATTAETPPCLRPEAASSALCVCAHMCECVKLGVRLSALEPLVCLTGGWSQGSLWTSVGASEACTGCVHGCVPVKAPRLHSQRKSEVVLHPGTCCLPSLSLQRLAEPEWAFLVKPCCLGEAPKGPGRQGPSHQAARRGA